MGHRTRKLIAVAVAALAVTTACGEGSEPASAAGSAGDADNPKKIASADEVIRIVDKGFVTNHVEAPGIENDDLSYGLVIENVSDEVALDVRLSVEFTDEAGESIQDSSEGHAFSVVLPGQRLGVGGSDTYAGPVPGGDRPVITDMTVRVTFITALDTMDGKRHRKPPTPYAELATGDPVAADSNGRHGPVTVEVTNTYDIPVRPSATAVIRDADGVIVGGMDSEPVAQEVQPGDSARVRFLGRYVELPRVAEGTIECYADPNLVQALTRTPVWQDL